MEYTYEKVTDDFGGEMIKRTDEDGIVSWIPLADGNSDYAEYLESLEPKAKATKVVDAPIPE